MSRIGKKPVEIPIGTTVEMQDDVFMAKGPKGELRYTLPPSIKLSVDDGKIFVERTSDKKTDRGLHGMARSIIANMVIGVSQGYKKILSITGVGYRAQVKGESIVFTLGYSLPVEYQLPAGVIAVVDDKQTTITLTGFDKQLIGQAAANIRELRPPDSYKGKGIRYAGERLKLKAGKTGKK